MTLTVTDDDGVSRSLSKTVNVPGNRAPVADFDAQKNKLQLAVDASASSDADGGPLTYAWDFGESSGSSDQRTGKTVTYTYGGPGTYTVGLTVTDDEGVSTSTSQVVQITGNQAPQAVIAPPAIAGLQVTVNGGSSTDADGNVASYAWDFGAPGSGDTATGSTAAYTYPAAGTYTVTLTVTDNDGDTNTATVDVTVQDGIRAIDSFTRAVTTGWGTSELGGPWTSIGTAARFSVAGGQGVQSNVGTNLETDLAGLSLRDTDVTVSVGLDKLPPSFLQAWVNTRKVGANSYAARLRFNPDGTYGVHLTSNNTPLVGANAIAGATYAPGDRIWVRFRTQSTSPTSTTLQVKLWKAGTTEPATWNYTRVDTTAANQVSGSVSVKSYVARRRPTRSPSPSMI